MTVISTSAITDPKAVKEFCLRWSTAWNDHDGDAVAALCAEDLVYDEPALGQTVYGREPIKNFVTEMARAFPDNTFALEGLFADVRRRAVLVAWKFTGTFARSGRMVEFHGDDRLEFGEDGLITTYRCLYDNDLVNRQIRDANR
ncbi:nuclear transport factor 2 family protein [Mycolicibacterium sphagni]|uniref:Nuclear transport factor 2 family protein n=1 Tax=Mycolicibacterium sphagni TaxID=1786 RepID=A0ABX2K9T3_9MYCO|nr:nuclear transport factor 2 family protein [Mycolicibacterium sphagni]NTY63766.1 nuclear transport factor 2 family protein [Mycolicibacterium sphagni]